MRAETKAKRRVTLSIVGLGWTDESELSSLPRARVVAVEEAEGPAASEPAEPADAAAPAQGARARSGASRPSTRDAGGPPTPIVDPRAAAEAVQVAAARRDPIWRCQVALAEACHRAGLATAPLADDASRADVQAWIDRHRAALRERAA
jgi:hypothetical protein